MAAPALEVRQEFQIREDVLAFGFRGGRVADDAALRLGCAEVLASIQAAENDARPCFVVLDVRPVQLLSSQGLAELIKLDRMLGQGQAKLILLGLSPPIRDIFFAAGLGDRIALVTDENELRHLLGRSTACRDHATKELTIEFSEAELAEMVTGGITLDDAIRVIERLRG
jgi:anti-anti-sigma factor